MESRSAARILTCLILLGFTGFVAIQFVRPALANPAVTADLQAPPEVKRILRNSCYDCHSNQTQLRWFDRIQPAYWLVAKDVKDGRAHLNFSEIGTLPAGQQKIALYEALNQAQLGAMPLPQYTLLHPNARISDDDLANLKNYLHPGDAEPEPDPKIKGAAETQYNQWIQASHAPRSVAPAPNGIDYLSGYRDWKVVSTTDRFDNHTLRIIFGNDVAVHAIAEHKINPWPQGTAFAKAAWTQQVDADGNTRPGSFIQVEFMIKDSQKYASTGGWGYARWRGVDLKPYGRDAAFTSECVGCHNPVRRNDYVYSFPLEGQQ